MGDCFGFRSLHPIVLLCYYAGGMTFGILLFHPIVLIAGWAAMLAVNLALDGGRELRKWALPMLLGTVFIMLINPILSHRGRTVLYYIGDIPFTLESMIYGVTLALSVLSVLTLFVSYRLVMTEQKFLYLFGRLSPRVALVTMMALGLVPRLRRRMQQLMLVQRTRGITVTEGSLGVRARNGARLVSILLTWSLEDALQTADSMQARGYGTGARSTYLSFRFRARDGWVLAGLVCCIAVIVMAWAAGHGWLEIYPKLGAWAFTRGDSVALAGYLLFLLLPLGLEWRDRSLWRILNYNK